MTGRFYLSAMIPETGSRSELKRAWFDSLYEPVVGEVYVYHAHIRMYYRVVEVIQEPKWAVRVDVYQHFPLEGYYKRAGSTVRFTQRQWRMNLRHRQMSYHAAEMSPIRGVMA